MNIKPEDIIAQPDKYVGQEIGLERVLLVRNSVSPVKLENREGMDYFTIQCFLGLDEHNVIPMKISRKHFKNNSEQGLYEALLRASEGRIVSAEGRLRRYLSPDNLSSASKIISVHNFLSLEGFVHPYYQLIR